MIKTRDVFIYWEGPEFKLIKLLREIIYMHANSGVGYNVNLINRKNLDQYIDIPPYFDSLCLPHQADYVRVHVICDHGGIWLDSDTLVMESLDSLFDILDTQDGFFMKQNNQQLFNGVFGSNKHTPLMERWKSELIQILNVKGSNIQWTEIGNSLLDHLENTTILYQNYKIFDGLDSLYPVNWDLCVEEFLTKNYENYKTIRRSYQPLIVLVNTVYRAVENMENIENTALNYFMKKSQENLIDIDFVEIGTSNFDTLIQTSTTEIGFSVEPLSCYLDSLPNKPLVTKLNVAITGDEIHPLELDFFYIPEETIIEKNLPIWFKGCNTINNYHPLHVSHNLQEFVKIEKVKCISIRKFLVDNKIRNIKFLKIDTEGHDINILNGLFNYIKVLPVNFYPIKILFESNEHTLASEIDLVLEKFLSIGYQIVSRGYDTVIEYTQS